VTLSLTTTLQQWVLFTATALAVGCVAWRWIVAQRAASALNDDGRLALGAIERRVASLGALTAVVLLAAWLLRGVVQLWGFRDPFVPISEDISFLLFETFWGTTWMVQGVLVLLLGAAFLVARGRGTAAWSAATVLTLAVVATLALSSHSMGADTARAFWVAADGIHALAAGSWIGSLGIILVAGRDRGPTASGVFAAQIRAFSPLAVVSVTGLLSMGTLLAWNHLEGLSNLWTTGYGRVLLAKVGVAVAVLGAGFVNWRRGIPILDSTEGAASVQQRAAWEVSLAGIVLLLTAVLVHSAKP
jgi:putative copper export protein